MPASIPSSQTCSNCGKEKSASEFYIRKESGKLRSTCKRCHGERSKKYQRHWSGTGSFYNPKWAKEYAKKIRAEVIQAYGGKCACCGEVRDEFLCVDHVNGGGTKHRKQLRQSIYGWLRRNGFPKGFRILCANCNHSLGRYGYCPHAK